VLRAGLRRKEGSFSSLTQHLPLSARKRALGDVLGYLRDAPNGAVHRDACGILSASSETRKGAKARFGKESSHRHKLPLFSPLKQSRPKILFSRRPDRLMKD
jgi:hypothetical protein